MPGQESIIQAFEINKDKLRKRFIKYTIKAFQALPKIHHPRILDMGCGSGIPTMELARLSHGQVVGIDINQTALDKLTNKSREAGLSNRIQVMHRSMSDLTFPDQSFDIIWSEGSIYVIGFDNGLKEWKRFLKPSGFMVIHDEKGDITQKFKQISDNGYKLLSYFALKEAIWWTEYFAPLEKLIHKIQIEHPHDKKLTGAIQKAQQEIDMFKKNPERNSSAYFIIKKV